MKTLKLRYLLFWCLLAPVMISCDRGSDVQPIDPARKGLRVAASLGGGGIGQYCPTASRWEYLLCLPAGDFHGSVKAAMIADSQSGINAANLGGNPDVCYDRNTKNLIFKSTQPGNNGTYVSDISYEECSEC